MDDRSAIKVLACAGDTESDGEVFVEIERPRRFRAEVAYFGLVRAHGLSEDAAIRSLRIKLTRHLVGELDVMEREIEEAIETLERVTKHERAVRVAIRKVGA